MSYSKETNKLIIWDFDGVISDTEKLWVNVWIEHMSEKYPHIENTNEQWFGLLSGISDDEKAKRINAKYEIKIDKTELDEIFQKELDRMYKGFDLTKGVLDLFKNTKNQCIATGGPFETTLEKVRLLKLQPYFNEKNIFARDMVKYGKPAPDLFLLAAEKMGFEPKDCTVIDDAITGAVGAIKANMNIITYTEHLHVGKNDIISEVKKLGVSKVANNMQEVKNYISNQPFVK